MIYATNCVPNNTSSNCIASYLLIDSCPFVSLDCEGIFLTTSLTTVLWSIIVNLMSVIAYIADSVIFGQGAMAHTHLLKESVVTDCTI